MKKKGYLLFLLMYAINYAQIINNNIFLNNNKYPFVLPYPDDEYYYVITSGESLKINKESGNIIERKTTNSFSHEPIYCYDKSGNSYIYESKNFYAINYSSLSISHISHNKNSDSLSDKYTGCIPQDNDFIIYGYDSNHLIFLSFTQDNSYKLTGYKELSNKISCKFVENKEFICLTLFDKKIKIFFFYYDFNKSNKFSSIRSIDDDKYNEYINIALYDTSISTKKILCKQKEGNLDIYCRFFQIYFNRKGKRDIKYDNKFNFGSSSNDFFEKDCSLSEFNDEYLFCCGFINSIKCARFNLNTNLNLIGGFKFSINNKNTYLTVKINNLFSTLFFMNDNKEVYEYKFYLIECYNKVYTFENSLNENEEVKLKLSELYMIKTNNYNLKFINPSNQFNIYHNSIEFKINNEKKEFDEEIHIDNNEYIIDFIIQNDLKKKFSYIKVDYYIFDEYYTNQCFIKFNFMDCYHSCKQCSFDKYLSNQENHNCLECKENYYPSPTNETNCYMENETEINWYLDKNSSSFQFCNEECKSCYGPSNNECDSCKTNSYLFLGHCQNKCPSGYLSELVDNYYICSDCFENCETCLDKEIGNFTDMKCIACKDYYIKYKNNCYIIVDSKSKSFYDPENNNEKSSCYQKFNLYIKEDSYECIEFPDEGYYISNNMTGLLSKCHENCLSCDNSIIQDDSKNLRSMECLSCKDSNAMIKFEKNCFNIIQYDENRIIFNITEMKSNEIGTCLYFNKSIYNGKYNCIDKPEHTYFVLNGSDNTGVIKNCSISCKSCYGESNNETTNCIECAEDYYKTEDSNTNCIKKDSIPNNYYKNESDNIYYKCHENCQSCDGLYNITTNDMHCTYCVNDSYFIYNDNHNNCYYQNDTFISQKYYLSNNDFKFHKCYYSCSTCQNVEPNETEHYCINCCSGFYFLENTTNCYDMNITKKEYYLDNYTNINKSEIKPIFKKCYKSCKTCIKYKENIDEENHNCILCADNYYKLGNGLYPNNCYDNETIASWIFLVDNTINIYESSFISSKLDKSTIIIQSTIIEDTTENKFTSYILQSERNIETTEELSQEKELDSNYIKEEEEKEKEIENEENEISQSTIYIKSSLGENSSIQEKKLFFYSDKIDIISTEILSTQEKYNNFSTNIIESEEYIISTEKSMKCHISCLTCNENNSTICLECNNKDGYYPLYNNNSSCYNNETIAKDYCLDTNSRIWKKECIYQIDEQKSIITELRKEILKNISSYKNTTKVINGTNFIAAVLFSDNMDPEEQIKNGISAIDLGNCTDIIKEYYNISKDESLIIFNIETKNENNNNNTSFNLGKNTKVEIYDMSGNEIDLSVCKKDIKVMKYIGDVKELNIDSAKSLSEQGIDIFNASNGFFNDICHLYISIDGKDIILNDRRANIYQNATFCQKGCTYLGMNYNLMVANCKCDSSVLQEKENNTKIIDKAESNMGNFENLKNQIILNLIEFNYEVLRCYNLVFNKDILLHNIGFFCLSIMLIFQIIFFFIYLIRKVEPIKIFMMIFNDIQKINKQNIFNLNKNPPKKNKYVDNSSEINKKLDNDIKINKNNIYKNKNNINKKKENNNNIKKIISNNNEQSYKKLISKDYSELNNNKRNIYISNNIAQTINIKVPMININKKNFKKKHLKLKLTNKKNLNRKIINNKYKMETMSGNKLQIDKIGLTRLLKNDEEIQDMEYEEAIHHDKRPYFRMYWSFLLESQIILETFCTDNHLYLFVVKLSFFICTFQISFFLNALFYTDDYISEAYHNDGVLDFISGLPKVILSFIATLITTNLLKMLSNNKRELTRVIRRRNKYNNYLNIINIKMTKLRKKIFVYFILSFALGIFFLYYVTAFCAVYRNSQKYWFYGCVESFAMDSLVSVIVCIFLSFLRYISIKNKIKCCFVLANIIRIFF